MPFAWVAVPAAPVRKKPNHRVEMTNQLLFGETVEVVKEKGNLWVKIRSLHDLYEGWTTRTLLTTTIEKYNDSAPAFVTAGAFNAVSIGGMTMNVPIGSSLPSLIDGKGRLGKLEYGYNGKFLAIEGDSTPDHLEQLVLPWLNSPYQWGGRTMFGVDCSGFVQVNFKMLGIGLQRDAWQQAQQGIVIKKLKDAAKGDLAFFDDRDEIVHVGILLGPDKIIHASGKVRIDSIDKKGIINSDSNSRTHSLRAIRRYF